YLYRVLAIETIGEASYSNEASVSIGAGQNSSASTGGAAASGGFSNVQVAPAPPPSSPNPAIGGAAGGAGASSSNGEEIFTAEDFGNYAMAHINGRPGQHLLVQISDDR